MTKLSNIKKFVTGAGVALIIIVFVERWRSSELQCLLTQPSMIEWNGIAIDLPKGYQLVGWPGTGFPAYRVTKIGAESEHDGAVYFSFDLKVIGSGLGRMVQTQEQCSKIGKYCVAVHTEQATQGNPFCRAAYLANDNHEKSYILDLQYEFGDSNTMLAYWGRPEQFAEFLPLFDIAFSKYAKQHGLEWKTSKECVQRLFEIAGASLKGADKSRPLRADDR